MACYHGGRHPCLVCTLLYLKAYYLNTHNYLCALPGTPAGCHNSMVSLCSSWMAISAHNYMFIALIPYVCTVQLPHPHPRPICGCSASPHQSNQQNHPFGPRVIIAPPPPLAPYGEGFNPGFSSSMFSLESNYMKFSYSMAWTVDSTPKLQFRLSSSSSALLAG